MFKDTISLIVAGISVVYILFANPAQAAVPPAAPAAVPFSIQKADNSYSNIEVVIAASSRQTAPHRDSRQWRLLPANEIHRLLAIYAQE